MKIPSEKELVEFLEDSDIWFLEDSIDLGELVQKLHDYLMNYNSNEEPLDE